MSEERQGGAFRRRHRIGDTFDIGLGDGTVEQDDDLVCEHRHQRQGPPHDRRLFRDDLLVFYRWGNVIGIDMAKAYADYARFAHNHGRRASVVKALEAEGIRLEGAS
jgi:hypothetical protein